jgi:hypothetical protein
MALAGASRPGPAPAGAWVKDVNQHNHHVRNHNDANHHDDNDDDDDRPDHHNDNDNDNGARNRSGVIPGLVQLGGC